MELAPASTISPSTLARLGNRIAVELSGAAQRIIDVATTIPVTHRAIGSAPMAAAFAALTSATPLGGHDSVHDAVRAVNALRATNEAGWARFREVERSTNVSTGSAIYSFGSTTPNIDVRMILLDQAHQLTARGLALRDAMYGLAGLAKAAA